MDGRDWEVAVNVPNVKAVRAALDGFDLADPTGKEVLKLDTDTVLLVNLLWVLCEEQAKTFGVPEENFGRMLVGDPIDRAAEALVEARINFSRGPTKSLLRKTIETNEAVREAGTKVALEKLDDPKLMEQVTQKMAERMDAAVAETLENLTLSSSATNSPDKPEST